ncbi:hypothetical protein HRG_003809 [Hirsutella rhossiliensis]|uniref:Uncharacterized protein n=1 Tax=Hirsutella rhossiliensis TaxID=111463 RepID=A0A9P8SJY8_9HYPO|nr:uncharacterized protein HRG_03809 [Hirsutella rhossiliensis]KAH0965793.1 hypothetical protein HRG_03809 [Hirsutella rhossiliensis]
MQNASKMLVYEKDLAVNAEVHHERTHLERPTPVRSVAIHAEDWTVDEKVRPLCDEKDKNQTPGESADKETSEAGACTHFDRLEVRLKLGNGISGLDGAGTFDDITLKIGGDSLTLAKHPSRGTVDTRNIDLQKAFGSASVPKEEIRSFRLSSVKDERYNPDSWELAGITFEGKCTGSSKVAKVDKYASLYEWFNRYGEGGSSQRTLCGSVLA